MFYRFIAVLFIFTSSIVAFGQETEPAATSNLTGVRLPAGAERVLPGSVPAEVSAAFDKITAGAKGKLEKGESEVLVWAGRGYKKSNAPATVDRIGAALKANGWQFSVEGDDDGLTVFSAFLDGANRRAIVGFYGATDEALVFSWVELVKPGAVAQTEQEPAEPVGKTVSNAGAVPQSILGTWGTGSVSMLNEKNLSTGVVSSRGGTVFKYVFTRDGRFEFIGYMESLLYGCTTTIFNDKRGTYKVSGNTIMMQPTKNYWKNQYSCSPSSNKEQNYTLKPETVTFVVNRNDYGKEQICLNDGKNNACYERKE